MPATRSVHNTPRPQPFPTPSPPQKRRLTPCASEVLSLSSDTEPSTDPHPKKRQNKVKPNGRPKRPVRAPPTDEEIIEISSGDESPLRRPEPSVIAEYRREIGKLREESVRHKKNWERSAKDLKLAREENQKLQAIHSVRKGKVVLDEAKLSDYLDCEICTGRMWTPYILPDCGHSFCQSCLQDWFSTTQAQFLAIHPENHNHNHAILSILNKIMHHPHIATHPEILQLLAANIPPQPVYTCPTCRETVRSRPTEDFTLKAIVGAVAEATGEPAPKKIPPPSNPKGKGTRPVAGHWDGFFPPPRKP